MDTLEDTLPDNPIQLDLFYGIIYSQAIEYSQAQIDINNKKIYLPKAGTFQPFLKAVSSFEQVESVMHKNPPKKVQLFAPISSPAYIHTSDESIITVYDTQLRKNI